MSAAIIYSLPRSRAPRGAGARRGPRAPGGAAAAPEPLPGAVPAARVRHCRNRRRFDLLLYMQH